MVCAFAHHEDLDRRIHAPAFSGTTTAAARGWHCTRYRTFEFATFFADISKGAFQLYSLRWIGGNQDPDIFEDIFDSSSFPPYRHNRSFYSNPRIDELHYRYQEADNDTHTSLSISGQAERDDGTGRHIVAEDLPYINLWNFDNVLVHTNRVRESN